MIDNRNLELGDTFALSERALKRHEAAEFLGIAPGTLANWHCAGKGPRSVVLGQRARRYLMSDLIAYVRQLEAGGGVH